MNRRSREWFSELGYDSDHRELLMLRADEVIE
jgi:hypothetical protein